MPCCTLLEAFFGVQRRGPATLAKLATPSTSNDSFLSPLGFPYPSALTLKIIWFHKPIDAAQLHTKSDPSIGLDSIRFPPFPYAAFTDRRIGYSFKMIERQGMHENGVVEIIH